MGKNLLEKNLPISMNRELFVSTLICFDSNLSEILERVRDSDDDGEIEGEEIDDDFAEGGGKSREETRTKKSFIWMILFVLWRIRNWSTKKIRFVEFVKVLPLLLFPLIPVK